MSRALLFTFYLRQLEESRFPKEGARKSQRKGRGGRVRVDMDPQGKSGRASLGSLLCFDRRGEKRLKGEGGERVLYGLPYDQTCKLTTTKRLLIKKIG